MPEWSKGVDLRPTVEKRAGSNPALSTLGRDKIIYIEYPKYNFSKVIFRKKHTNIPYSYFFHFKKTKEYA